MTSRIKPLIGMPIEHVLEAPMDGRAYVRVNGEWVAIVEDIVHGVRVWAADATINSAIANGGVLRFDTIGVDTDNFAPSSTPFSVITIPPGRDGIYLVTARSSGNGNQATSLGMGVLLNGSAGFSETNQTIWGPGSVNYTLDNDATQILQLAGSDTIELINNSVSSGPNAFTSVSMAVVRFDPGLKVLSAMTRPT